jgi:cysteinyl-tRNA synthetase
LIFRPPFGQGSRPVSAARGWEPRAPKGGADETGRSEQHENRKEQSEMATYIAPFVNGDNTNFGSQQVQYAFNGNDVLAPSNDDKPYYLYGGEGNDELIGQSYNDDLFGGAGSDLLYGDYGNDYLNGGRGRDYFGFDTSLNKNQNVDTIADFQAGNDEIWLSRSIFKGVGNENTYLKSSKFEVGGNASSTKTRILYNENKGIAYYTKKGSDGNKVKFAELTPGQSLENDDFYIIA